MTVICYNVFTSLSLVWEVAPTPALGLIIDVAPHQLFSRSAYINHSHPERKVMAVSSTLHTWPLSNVESEVKLVVCVSGRTLQSLPVRVSSRRRVYRRVQRLRRRAAVRGRQWRGARAGLSYVTSASVTAGVSPAARSAYAALAALHDLSLGRQQTAAAAPHTGSRLILVRPLHADRLYNCWNLLGDWIRTNLNSSCELSQTQNRPLLYFSRQSLLVFM